MKYIIFFLFLISLSSPAQYYVTYNRSELDSINSRINEGLKQSVRGYTAVQYFSVHSDSLRFWAYIPPKREDSRDPQKYLNETELAALVSEEYMKAQRLLKEPEMPK